MFGGSYFCPATGASNDLLYQVPIPPLTTTITHDDEDEDGDNDSWVCERDCIGQLLPRQQLPLLILLLLLLLLLLVGFTTITSIMTNTKMQ